jgi:hypothetical protein
MGEPIRFRSYEQFVAAMRELEQLLIEAEAG